MTEYKKIKYLIIGGGITGITLARLLQLKGIDDFIVLEADKTAGGLCRSVDINGCHLDIGGGHFLCSKYPEVYDFIFSHLPKSEFNYYDRVSKIKLENNIIDYPMESNLWQLPVEDQIRYLTSVIQAGESVGYKEPKNYEDWIKWKLGNEIADHYMIPYNIKIWGVSPKKMDIDWLYKIPKLNIDEVLSSSLIKRSDTSKYPSHSGFYYPKNGGFQIIFDSIFKMIKNKVILNFSVNKIKYHKGRWIVNNTYIVENLINTAPWPKLYKALGFPKKLKKYFFNLKSNSLVVSLWKENITHNWHWLYDPNLNRENHREFYIKNFSETSNKDYIYTETNLKRWPGKGKFKRDKKYPIFEFINKEAYPIPIIGHTKAIDKILSFYKKKKLFGVGRWGQWKYLNADVCIKEAMNFVNNIENNQK